MHLDPFDQGGKPCLPHPPQPGKRGLTINSVCLAMTYALGKRHPIQRPLQAGEARGLAFPGGVGVLAPRAALWEWVRVNILEGRASWAISRLCKSNSGQQRSLVLRGSCVAEYYTSITPSGPRVLSGHPTPNLNPNMAFPKHPCCPVAEPWSLIPAGLLLLVLFWTLSKSLSLQSLRPLVDRMGHHLWSTRL